jgi:ribosomal protein S18 acetylase RimI-like enzyme
MMSEVVVRPMTDADVPGAVRAFSRGFQAIGTPPGVSVSSGPATDEPWRQARARHFLTADPGGSWVAVEDGGGDDDAVLGMAQAIVRDGYWTLAQLATVPEAQGQGIGGQLLRHAMSYGDPDRPGTIQCSYDPRAMALYSAHGFCPHPATAGIGLVRHPAPRPDGVERYLPDRVDQRVLETVASVDRSVRGSARTVDLVAMLEQPGSRLLLHGDQGYAVARDDRVVTLAARDDESATLLLRTMLAEAPSGEAVEVSWMTSRQQWAISELVRAGVALQASGPVMVRGMDGPPRPYIPSGAFG